MPTLQTLARIALAAIALACAGCDPSTRPNAGAQATALPATAPVEVAAPRTSAAAPSTTPTAAPAGPPAASLLPADRITTWNPGLNALGGIPARTKTCATLAPSGGDDTQAIQAAIDKCPAHQVVLLAAGTFNITGQGIAIERSNVTLRGAGPSSTRLTKPKGTSFPVIIIGHRWPKYIDQTPLAADALKDASELMLAGPPPSKVPLKPGELVVVDHLTDAQTLWSDRSPPGDPSRGWFGEMDRPIGQVLEVASVRGDRVTFTTPLHAPFRVADGAQLTRFASNGAPITVPTQMSGVEDLYVEYGEGGDGGGNIHLFATKACWVKNVESSHSSGHSVNLDGTFRSEVRDSFFHSTVNPSPGGAGYGMGMNAYASDNLFENNVSWNFNKVIVMRKTGGGNVVAYNYLEDGYGAGYPTIVEIGLCASHLTTSHHELFEGNQAFNFGADSVWGNSIDVTVFRNHFTSLRRSLKPGTPDGVQVPLVDVQARRAVGLSEGHWAYSFIANVLGYPEGYLGYPPLAHPVYELTSRDRADATVTPMWQLGSDPKVVATTVRHGNFDYATSTVVWDAAIASHSLPASLYLTSKPAFFGSAPWPWVTPETAPQTLATLPARTRFDALMATR